MSDDTTPDIDTYSLISAEAAEIAVPDMPYRPPMPKGLAPRIGLIGAGGIVPSHLDAYRSVGWDVAWICNRTISKAQARADEFYPEARVSSDWQDVLDDPEIGVVDITPHPGDRLPIMQAALKAGKHVLSQKPFVLDLDEGENLIALARDNGVKLAVNQNGRWSPNLAYMREAVKSGLIGKVIAVHCAVHWDHGWIAGTPFEKIDDLILYDFAIHWFDFLNSIIGARAETIFASTTFAEGQTAKVPLMAQAQVRFAGGQASLVFDGSVKQGPLTTAMVAGTKGSIYSHGADVGNQKLTLATTDGAVRFRPEGNWFKEGFIGAMGELMLAIEEDREPINGAGENLASLALAFAAIQSRKSGQEVEIGAVRSLQL